ncbi:Holliday junction branch migration protein RuvA [Propionicicella superfundia]|uniref:Holliday junction branch migration protein RuvA n=1 Tax=Propionicicella superfundia TaxID=348582 RepID=UPI0003FB06BA|nr:Holliday junction branch migration protein RuvA [Propionicicella superfundia]
MISQLAGTVVDLGVNWLVVSVGGLGLKAWCPPQTVMATRRGSETVLETSLIVRQDALTLYGFAAVAERDAFELLLSVSGVGPKLALAVISVMNADELAVAVTGGDTGALTKVPGIGPKAAQRLMLELKDKVPSLLAAGGAAQPAGAADELWREQVRDGLVGLGWSVKEAEAACEAVAADAAEGASLAVLMRAALQRLAKK